MYKNLAGCSRQTGAFMNRRDKLEMVFTFLGYTFFIVGIVYMSLLMMWKLHYPTCIPGYAPEMFRVVDDKECVYKSALEMAKEDNEK
jgi:hypothetical protein